MSNQKSLNIELLRCLAVISVILIHMTMGHFYDALLMHENKLSWIVSNLYYSLTRFCVPIFFIISAYLVFNNKSNKKWHERLVRLGLPFVAWSAIYYVYGGGRDASEFLKKILTENTSFHLWFFPPFIGYTLLLPAIKILFISENKDKFKYIFVIIFLSSIFTPSLIMLLNYFIGGYSFIYGISNFCLTLPPLLVYGFAFSYFYKKVNVVSWFVGYLVIIILNMMINIIISNKLGTPNEWFYGYTSVLVFISSFVLFNVVMSMNLSFLPEMAGKVVLIVGQCSLGIYLSHWLVFLILSKHGLLFSGRAIVDPILNTVIVFCASIAFTLVVRIIKPLRYIL